jgi:hypothetical protein
MVFSTTGCGSGTGFSTSTGFGSGTLASRSCMGSDLLGGDAASRTFAAAAGDAGF